VDRDDDLWRPSHGRLPLDFRVVFRFLGSIFAHPWLSPAQKAAPLGRAHPCRLLRRGGASLSPVGAWPAAPQRSLLLLCQLLQEPFSSRGVGGGLGPRARAAASAHGPKSHSSYRATQQISPPDM